MFENRPLSADDLQNCIIPVVDKGHIEIRPLTTDELPPETLDAFLAVGYTSKAIGKMERFFDGGEVTTNK